MAEEKPLTKSDLVAALKEVGVATKDDVRQIIGEEISARGLATKDDVRQIVGEEIIARGLATKDDIHNELTEFYAGMTEPVFAALRKKIKVWFRKVDKQLAGIEYRLKKLETGQFHIKDQIEGLKAEFSVTPSRQEFNDLKAKVDRYHPSN